MRAVLWGIVACGGTTSTDVPESTDRPEPPAPTASTATPTAETGLGPTAEVTEESPVLVVPYRQGIHLLTLDGAIVWSRTWTQMVGPCGQCGGEGASVDGNGMLVSFTTIRGQGGLPPGGIARLDATGSLDFRVDGFGFPHDAIRDPLDNSIMVTETSNNQIRWIDGKGGSDKALRALSTDDIRFGGQPNGADRFDYDGRSYLLLSHRRAGRSQVGFGGILTLWDITTDSARFVWRFPETGTIDTPHAPTFSVVDGTWWLLWAHTGGAPGPGGTVGLGATDDPTVRPTYVADLLPGADVGMFGFLRGVDRTEDGLLVMTDTGILGGGPTGRVILAEWPTLEIPDKPLVGSTGNQTFVDLGPTTVILDGIDNAYEGWLWEGRFEEPGKSTDE